MTDLPPGWEWSTLGEIAAWYGGGTPSKHNAAYWLNGTIPWLSPKDMRADTLRATQDMITVQALAESSTRLVPEGSVAIVTRSGILERKLPVAVVPFEVSLNQDMRAGVPYGEISPAWVAHYLRATERSLLANCSKHGTTVASLDTARLMATRIPVAPIEEQRRIVAALDDHLSRIDVAARHLSRCRRRLDPLRRSVLDAAVHGGLSTTMTQGDSASLRPLERTAPRKIDYRDLRFLPKGWEWHVASEVCESIVSGGTPPAERMYPGSGDVPFIKVYNLTTSGELDFSTRPTFIDRATHEGSLKRSRVSPGDVLTNIVGPPLGKTAVVPGTSNSWNINQAVVAFRAGPVIDHRWLALVIQAPSTARLLARTARATAGQLNISLSTCRELPIPVPPEAEQQNLVEIVDNQLSRLDRLSEELKTRSLHARRLRTSVLTQAFAGRLVPQDPDDEPASVLLERIGAERAAQSKPKRGRRTTIRQSQEPLL